MAYECECLNIVPNEFHETQACPRTSIHGCVDKDQMKSQCYTLIRNVVGRKNCVNFKDPTGSELKVEGTYCKFSAFFEEGPQDGGSAFGNV